MEERYDVAVIGTGPAGLSAAITLKVRNKSVLLLGSKLGSSKVFKAHEISNYLGIPSVKGEDLNEKFAEHLKQMDLQVTEENITGVYAMGDYYSLLTRTNKTFEATAIIIATGVNFGKPYPGEERYLGRGVSYCATCDAMFYKGKDVAVIGTSEKEEGEARFLAEVANKVYYIPTYENHMESETNIQVIEGVPLEIVGELGVTGLRLKEMEINVDGVFILRESISPAQLVPGLVLDGNHIQVNRRMETNLKGCFACGDIVGTPYQYIKAAGEGNVAAISAATYLGQIKK